MLARLEGYTINIINRKAAEKEDFCAKAAALSKKAEDESVLKEALKKKHTVFGVYDKKGTLCEWFDVSHEKGKYILSHEYVDKNISLILRIKLENLIIQEMMSEAIFHSVHEIEWRKDTYPVNTSKVWTSVLLGILFGIVVGFVFGLVTEIKALGIIIGILWAAACAMIFGSQELRKQQDLLNDQRISAIPVHLKKS